MNEKFNSFVLIDSDFLTRVVTQTENGEACFKSLMEALGKKPAIHEYIYKNEIDLQPQLLELVNNGIIKVIYYSDFLTKTYEELYLNDFKRLYSVMHPGETLSVDKPEDLFRYRLAENDLGEIHSVILANYTKIPIICSNDHGTKDLKGYLDSEKCERFRVFDVFDLIVELSRYGKHTCISKKIAIELTTYSTKDCSPKKRERIKARNKKRKSVLNEIYKD